MIWIIGEYAERIDNADELLESFLEGFHDENTQVDNLPSLLAYCKRIPNKACASQIKAELTFIWSSDRAAKTRKLHFL